jgi:hypothetical protein
MKSTEIRPYLKFRVAIYAGWRKKLGLIWKLLTWDVPEFYPDETEIIENAIKTEIHILIKLKD